MFKSTSGESVASTNTTIGTVVMATDYNVNASQYRAKSDMENSQFAQSFKGSVSAVHGIECEPSELPLKAYYIRGGNLGINDSLKFYDLANFQIATQGFQAASVNVGELWCTYLVEFLKPQIPVSIGGEVPTTRIVRASTTNATPLGLIGVANVGSLAVGVSGTGLTLTEVVPLQIYQVQIMWACTAALAWTPPALGLIGAVPINLDATNSFGTAIGTFWAPSTTGTSSEFMISTTFQINSDNTDNTVILSAPTWVGPVGVSNYVTIIVTKLDNAINPF